MLDGDDIRRDLDALDQRPGIRTCAGCQYPSSSIRVMLLCRFVGRPSGDAGVGGRGRQASDKRQGTKSRG